MASTLTSTTLGAAVAVGDKVITLAAVTNAVKDNVLVVNDEAMKVMADPVGVTVLVFRGWGGTKARAHASGALVWAATPAAFGLDEPAGAGVAANELYLPRVVPRTGGVFTLVNSVWVKVADKGHPIPLPGGAIQDYTADGALTVIGGVHTLTKGSALAATLAAPGSLTPEGTIMHIIATTAQAHTVTYTPGFLGGTTSNDVATFGGAIGDCLTIQNQGGVWRPIALRNVTFG